MTYILNGETYPTKQAVTKQVQHIRNKYQHRPTTPIGPRSVGLINALTGGYPGSGMDYTELYVRPTEPYGTITICTKEGYAVNTTNGIRALGKTKKQAHRDRVQQDRLRTARRVIQPDIDAYKESHTVPHGWEIDHVVPFQELFNQWCLIERFDITRQDWNEHTRLSWSEYHHAHAQLRAIPREQNRGKGSGGVQRLARVHGSRKVPPLGDHAF